MIIMRAMNHPAVATDASRTSSEIEQRSAGSHPKVKGWSMVTTLTSSSEPLPTMSTALRASLTSEDGGMLHRCSDARCYAECQRSLSQDSESSSELRGFIATCSGVSESNGTAEY